MAYEGDRQEHNAAGTACSGEGSEDHERRTTRGITTNHELVHHGRILVRSVNNSAALTTWVFSRERDQSANEFVK